MLLVDDDPLVDVVVKAVLKDQDFEIDYANSAIEALLSLSQKKYEVILMDIVMPELSGVEALHKIKKHSWCNNTAFIAHTASDKENCYEHYKSLGFDDVLLKPVKKDELLRSIDKVLSAKGDSHD
ncbi:response regulator [Pseudoalteromonas sp. BZK2]|nr:response regulator [Pseudoalteromonas sp. BZK2]